MASASYSFIDIAVLDEVRRRVAAGDRLLILDLALEEVVWSNGPGAAFFGFSGVEQSIGAPAGLSAVARRQLASVPGFPHMAGEHAVAARLGGQLSGRPVPLVVQSVTLPRGETAILIVVPAAHGAARSVEEVARDAVSGFAEAGSFAALVGEDGAVVAASDGFERLGIGSEVLEALVEEVRDEEDRLVKRLVATGAGSVAVGIARLTDGPRLNLLLAIEADGEAEPADAAAQPTAHADPILTAEEEGEERESFPRASVAIVPAHEAAEAVSAEPAVEDQAAGAEAVDPESGGRDDDSVSDDGAADEAIAENGEAVEGRDEEVAAPTDLVPEPQHAMAADAGPVRFVWRTDAEGRFTTISEEFAAAIGADASDVAGRPFGDVAARLGIDPDGAIAALLERRDTWSGRTVMWPLTGTDLRVPVDLAALPIYDRARHFEGFRGFGVARMADAVIDPHGIGSPSMVTGPSQGEDARAAAQAEDPFRGEKPAISIAPGADRREADKVIRLAEHRAAVNSRHSGDSLSVAERSAFREIGERLRRESGPGAAATLPEGRKPEVGAESMLHPDAEGAEPADAEFAAEDVDAQAEIEGRPHIEARSEGDEAAGADHAGGDAATADEAMLDEDGAEIDIEDIETDVEDGDGPAPDEDVSEEEPPAAAAGATVESFPETGEEVASDEPRPTAEQSSPPPLRKLEDLAPAVALAEPPPLPSAFCGSSSGMEGGSVMQLIAGLPVPILIHSGDRLHHANREFLRVTGYPTLEELEAAGGLGGLFAGQPEAGSGNLSLRTVEGDTVPVSAHLQSIPWAGGKALVLALGPAQTQPASDRIATLEARIAELRTIIDTATDGVVLIDSGGLVRSISRPAEALFGIDSEEIEGRAFTSLFAIESQKAAGDYLAKLAQNGVASVLNDGREVIGREKQGGFIPLFMTIGRLPGDGGFCAVLRDITHWKRAEEDLNRARAQAERSSSQKTEFLARVSHEVRTPLNAIIGFSELMLDEKFGPIGSERYREYLRDINRSGNHVLDLVNDLLDISKIEAGEQEMSYEAVSLNEALAETVAMMQPQANRERVIIRSSFVSRLPDVVADLRSIRQIALNLLSNAIRATPAGGQVIVSTAYEHTRDIVVRVRDTGIGMTSAEIEQALKPFKQINALKRSRGDGTGLGLPLTKALVEANRARFAITSAPGQGTLVEITFPATRVLAD